PAGALHAADSGRSTGRRDDLPLAEASKHVRDRSLEPAARRKEHGRDRHAHGEAGERKTGSKRPDAQLVDRGAKELVHREPSREPIESDRGTSADLPRCPRNAPRFASGNRASSNTIIPSI